MIIDALLLIGALAVTLACIWMTLVCYTALRMSDEAPTTGLKIFAGLVFVGTWVLWWLFVGSSIHIEIGVN